MTLELTFEPNVVPPDTILMIYAAPWRSPGQSFPPMSEFKFISVSLESEGSPLNVGNAYESEFGTVPEGTLVWVMAYFMSIVTGLTSSRLIASAVATS